MQVEYLTKRYKGRTFYDYRDRLCKIDAIIMCGGKMWAEHYVLDPALSKREPIAIPYYDFLNLLKRNKMEEKAREKLLAEIKN